MNKKRIIFFIESFAGGGAERVLYTILRYIDRDKFDITILVMSDVGVQREAFHRLGFEIKNVLNCKIGWLNKVKYKLLYNILPVKMALKWLLRGVEADTYVAFVEGYCTKVFSQLKSAKNKIAWVHIDIDTFPWTVEKGIYKCFEEEKNAYHRFDKVIGVSGSVTGVLRDKYCLQNSILLYNPIDEIRIKEQASIESNIEIDKDTFNVVSVGRLTRQKGYDELIRMMPFLISANPKIRLYIIGEGEDRPALEQEIARLKLEKYIILLGFLDNPYSLLKKMDLFVCSSRAEGFSLVIAEAMIVGLPIISMECAGPCELLDYGKYGILCKSYEELKEKILSAATDESLLQALKSSAKERGENFNTKDVVKSIEDML